MSNKELYKRPLLSYYHTVKVFFESLAPLTQEKALVLAVSGGGDSLAMTLIILAWAKTLQTPPNLHIAYVHHHLRPEAETEAKFVKNFALQVGVPFHLLHYHAASKTRLQERAREGRYKVLFRLCETLQAALITAHHLEDQCETFMMRLSKGSGLKGLCVMPFCREQEGVRHYRPFLTTPQKNLREILIKNAIAPLEDVSNSNENFERVRWRKALRNCPEMKNFSESLRRLQEAEDALESLASAFLQEENFSENFSFSQSAYQKLPRALRLRVLAKVFAHFSGETPYHLKKLETCDKRLHFEVKSFTLLNTLITPKMGRHFFKPAPPRKRGRTLEKDS